MTWLTAVLLIKIAVTAIIAAAPFLFLSKEKLASLLSLEAHNSALSRLYGVAIVALLVGYGFGVPAAQAGVFPWGVVAMGLVSNAGAAATLLVTGAASRARLQTAFYAVVAIALAAAALKPELALRSVF